MWAVAISERPHVPVEVSAGLAASFSPLIRRRCSNLNRHREASNVGRGDLGASAPQR